MYKCILYKCILYKCISYKCILYTWYSTIVYTMNSQHLRSVLSLDNCPSLDVQELLQNQINSSEGINNSLGK